MLVEAVIAIAVIVALWAVLFAISMKIAVATAEREIDRLSRKLEEDWEDMEDE